MGAAAEQWTASELRPLRRLGWRIVNHFSLRASMDIDHVMVGPGGVVAVETKWSAQGWTLDPPEPRVLAAANRARDNAKVLAHWHPVRSLGVTTVLPVVFLWGGKERTLPNAQTVAHTIGDVAIVVGSDDAMRWRAAQESSADHEQFNSERVKALWGALDDHARRRDAHDRSTRPSPPTLARLYFTAIAVAGVGILAFLIALQLVSLLDSWWLWAIACSVLALVGFLARRIGALRLLAVAWLTGLSGAVVLLAAVAANAALT
jgi:hypothetical protein